MLLLTWHGTLVCLRAGGGGLTQGRLDSMDTDCAPVEMDIGPLPPEGSPLAHPTLGQLRLMPAAGGRGLHVSRYARFLCAEDNGGDLAFSRERAHLWETFLPLPARAIGTLRHVGAHDWIDCATRQVIARRRLRLMPGFQLMVAGTEYDLVQAGLDQAGRGGEDAPDTLTLQGANGALALTLAVPRGSALLTLEKWPVRARREAEMMALAAHRNFLGREPEQAVLERDVAYLLENAGAAGLAALMDQLRTEAAGPAPDLDPAVGQAPAGACPVVGLGTACLTARAIQAAGLGTLPMPFDWLTATPAMVRHCIETDFAVLLDSAHYASLTGRQAPGEPEDGCDHEFYKSAFRIGRVFNHADPTRPADYRYLQACIERFRDVLASDGPKLFVQIFTNGSAATRAEFEATAALLDRVTKRAMFIQVGVDPSNRRRAVPFLGSPARLGAHVHYRLHPIAQAEGEDFRDRRDAEYLAWVIRTHAVLPATSPAVARAARERLAEAAAAFGAARAAAGYDEVPVLANLDSANHYLRQFLQGAGLPATTQFGLFDHKSLRVPVANATILVEINARRVQLRIDPGRKNVWTALHRSLSLIYVLDEMLVSGPIDSARVLAELGDEGTRTDSIRFCTKAPGGCLIPDSDFIASGGYEDVRQLVARMAPAWEARRRVVFWRGATTGKHRRLPPPEGEPDDFTWLPRLDLVARARRSPLAPYYDVGIASLVQMQAPWWGARIEAGDLCRPRASREDFIAARAIVVIDGNTNAWSALFCGLLSGSCVLRVESEHGFRQWYDDALKPWHHYVPVAADLSDMDERVEWVMTHDAEAQAIGEAGRALAEAMTLEREVAAAAARLRAWISKKEVLF